jgi:hypothetical protein
LNTSSGATDSVPTKGPLMALVPHLVGLAEDSYVGFVLDRFGRPMAMYITIPQRLGVQDKKTESWRVLPPRCSRPSCVNPRSLCMLYKARVGIVVEHILHIRISWYFVSKEQDVGYYHHRESPNLGKTIVFVTISPTSLVRIPYREICRI